MESKVSTSCLYKKTEENRLFSSNQISYPAGVVDPGCRLYSNNERDDLDLPNSHCNPGYPHNHDDLEDCSRMSIQGPGSGGAGRKKDPSSSLKEEGNNKKFSSGKKATSANSSSKTPSDLINDFWSDDDDDEDLFTGGVLPQEFFSDIIRTPQTAAGDVALKEECSLSPDKFQAKIEARGFTLSDIEVRVDKKRLLIHCKHAKSRGNTKAVFRELKRDIAIPDDVIGDDVTFELTDDGLLIVSVPRRKLTSSDTNRI